MVKKGVPNSIMPELGWDTTKQLELQEIENKTTTAEENTQEIEEVQEEVLHQVPETIIIAILLIYSVLLNMEKLSVETRNFSCNSHTTSDRNTNVFNSLQFRMNGSN